MPFIIFLIIAVIVAILIGGLMSNHKNNPVLKMLAEHPDGISETEMLAEGFPPRNLTKLMESGYIYSEKRGNVTYLRISKTGRAFLDRYWFA